MVKELVERASNFCCRFAQFLEKMFILTALVANLDESFDGASHFPHCRHELLLTGRTMESWSNYLLTLEVMFTAIGHF